MQVHITHITTHSIHSANGTHRKSRLGQLALGTLALYQRAKDLSVERTSYGWQIEANKTFKSFGPMRLSRSINLPLEVLCDHRLVVS